MDIASKFDRATHTEILREPLPERSPASAAPSQLFDLANDPEERSDLAAREPERVRRMEAALGAWFQEMETERRAIDDLP